MSLVCLLHYMLRTKYLIDGNLKKYDILLFCLGNQTNLVDKGGPSYRSKCTWISFLVTEKINKLNTSVIFFLLLCIIIFIVIVLVKKEILNKSQNYFLDNDDNRLCMYMRLKSDLSLLFLSFSNR